MSCSQAQALHYSCSELPGSLLLALTHIFKRALVYPSHFFCWREVAWCALQLGLLKWGTQDESVKITLTGQKCTGINDYIFPLFCFVINDNSSKRWKTLTWSVASHSDRFLQGRVEFSFISHVPSKVQNRYTCPCSTAISKTSHGVNGRRNCPWGKGHRAAWDLVQLFFPTDRSLGWRRKMQCCWGSAPPAPCLQQTLLLVILRARKQLGRTWLGWHILQDNC